jgi:hypothetical protein
MLKNEKNHNKIFICIVLSFKKISVGEPEFFSTKVICKYLIIPKMTNNVVRYKFSLPNLLMVS